MRLIAVLLLVLFACAIGGEAACWAGANDDCESESCACCNASAEVTGNGFALGLVGQPQLFALAQASAPLTPDLGRFTPPPRS